MEWLELVKVGADVGFVILCAGFVLWELRDMYTTKKEKDKNTTTRVRQMEDKRQARYDELLDNLEKKTDLLYDILIQNQKDTDKKYQDLLDKVLAGINKPHILSEEENSRMTKIDEEVNLFLNRALEISKASRIALIKYHNGGNDMLGNSILKMSVSNEKCAAGIMHVMNTFQNQLRSSFAYLVKELNDVGKCYIRDVEEIKELDNSLYQYLKQCGTKASYSIAINNVKTGSVIGFVVMDFINKDDVNIEQIEHCLRDKKNKIEALLNLE